MDSVRVQTEAFDAAAVIGNLLGDNTAMGAVVSFVGTMRDINEGDDVTAMTLEHYPGMTEKALQQIVAEAHQRWQLGRVVVIHRVGKLLPGDSIVLVAVTSKHRSEGFDACEFIIDYLKTRAPFWKKETTVNGGERWVDARESDNTAAEQWRPEEDVG